MGLGIRELGRAFEVMAPLLVIESFLLSNHR